MDPLPRLARLAAVLAALTFAAPALAQHAAPTPAAGGRSADLQGGAEAFMNNAHVRDFYALSVKTLGPGAPPLDVAAYEAKAFAMFRALGASMGGDPAAMQDHLKLIPRQVIQIAKADPSVLDSFEAFKEALIGPR